MNKHPLIFTLTAWISLAGQVDPSLPTTAPIHLKPSGLTLATLARECTIQGHRLDAGTVLRLDPSGSIQGFVLAREGRVADLPLPGGTMVSLTPQGLLSRCFLPRDTELQGHLLKGHGHDWMTTFHPNGQLKLVWLARDEWIEGIPCRRASFYREFLRLRGWGGTSFHANGRLASCALATDQVIQGRPLKQHARLHFDAEGRLVEPAP